MTRTVGATATTRVLVVCGSGTWKDVGYVIMYDD
jgi:hypothetical protein